jgi:hypothetical protein
VVPCLYHVRSTQRAPCGFQPFQVPWLYKITNSNGALCACALSTERPQAKHHLLSIQSRQRHHSPRDTTGTWCCRGGSGCVRKDIKPAQRTEIKHQPTHHALLSPHLQRPRHGPLCRYRCRRLLLLWKRTGPLRRGLAQDEAAVGDDHHSASGHRCLLLLLHEPACVPHRLRKSSFPLHIVSILVDSWFRSKLRLRKARWLDRSSWSARICVLSFLRDISSLLHE